MRLLTLLALPIALAACAEYSQNFATMKRPDPAERPYDVQVPQSARPDLDPTRKVSDSDCTRPVDPSGNLRCR
jgi:hypothetical protein